MENDSELVQAAGSNLSEEDEMNTAAARRPKSKTMDAKPRVTSFVARDCVSCTALRESDPETKGKSFSRVYAKSGRTRYCKCGYCGATWKQAEDTTA